MFLEIKLRRRDFLYWGLFDPKPLTEGPQAHMVGHAGQKGPGHPGRAGQPCPEAMAAGR
jgi:hypothetical protein